MDIRGLSIQDKSLSELIPERLREEEGSSSCILYKYVLKAASQITSTISLAIFDPVLGTNFCQGTALLVHEIARANILTSLIARGNEIQDVERRNSLAQMRAMRFSHGELTLIACYILTQARSREEGRYEIDPRQLPIDTGQRPRREFVRHLQRWVASTTVGFVQQIAIILLEAKEKEKGLKCLPFFKATREIMEYALNNRILIVLKAHLFHQEKQQVVGQYTLCYRWKVVWEKGERRFEDDTSGLHDPSTPVLVVLGTTRAENCPPWYKWIRSLEKTVINDVVLLNAASHPQYPGTRLGETDEECLDYKKIAEEEGCTLSNSSLFLVQHIHCEILGQIPNIGDGFVPRVPELLSVKELLEMADKQPDPASYLIDRHHVWEEDDDAEEICRSLISKPSLYEMPHCIDRFYSLATYHTGGDLILFNMFLQALWLPQVIEEVKERALYEIMRLIENGFDRDYEGRGDKYHLDIIHFLSTYIDKPGVKEWFIKIESKLSEMSVRNVFYFFSSMIMHPEFEAAVSRIERQPLKEIIFDKTKPIKYELMRFSDNGFDSVYKEWAFLNDIQIVVFIGDYMNEPEVIENKLNRMSLIDCCICLRWLLLHPEFEKIVSRMERQLLKEIILAKTKLIFESWECMYFLERKRKEQVDAIEELKEDTDNYYLELGRGFNKEDILNLQDVRETISLLLTKQLKKRNAKL